MTDHAADQKPQKFALARLALLVVLALGVTYWLTLMAISVTLVPQRGSDFAIYYAAAEVVRYTPAADLFSWPALVHVTQAHGGCAMFPRPRYVYPPLLAMLLEPLTLVPCGLAMSLWTGINAMLWAGATVLLAWRLQARWPAARLAAVTVVTIASAGFWQAIWGLWLGQVHLVVLFGIVLALVLHERGKPWLAGGVLAVAACIKFFPAFLLFYFLLRRDWKVLGGAAVAGVACILGMCLAVGVPEVARSLPVATQIVGAQARPGLNEALSIVLPGVGLALAVVIFMVFCAGVVAARGVGSDQLGATWAICTMLLVSPLVWSYYLVWLLPVFATCLGALPRDRRATIVLAIAFVAVAFPVPQVFVPLATLALWIVTGALFLRSGSVLARVFQQRAREVGEPAEPVAHMAQ